MSDDDLGLFGDDHAEERPHPRRRPNGRPPPRRGAPQRGMPERASGRWQGPDGGRSRGPERGAAPRAAGRDAGRTATRARPVDTEQAPPKDRGRRRLVIAVVAVVVLALVGAGVWYGLKQVFGFGYDDYQGSGRSDVLIQVQAGDSTNAIAERLLAAGVVASTQAFTYAGEDSDALRGVQPGYYLMKTRMSGKAAVTRIVDKANRVGELQIEPGSRLDDVKQPNGTIIKGIYSKLAAASCAELNGKSTCVSTKDLRRAAATADLASLGVPGWAAGDALRAEAARRIEGLIAPDVYQVRPGDSATELLRTVLTGSAARMQASGLPSIANGTGFTPYQVLVMASLIQSEAIEPDFAKVSRVTYNRLQKNQKLQYDSTVNYVLDRPEIRTAPEDRARAGPYNTYDVSGLPPTPISAPGTEALAAAAKPEDGNWLYFVKCEKDGRSCFAADAKQHQRNIDDAQARGVY
ncbi:MAG: endolytic transglycosylase MltG [Sciscionella sp.]